MGKLPTGPLALTPTRATLFTTSSSTSSTTRSSGASQLRHATFIPRPRRPYTFTQLVQLSDGSTYTLRTTSPQPLYRATKDTRNTLLWQPSERSLRNVELDEAGKLAAFRERFGRAFDAAGGEEEGAAQNDDYSDLITGYVNEDAASTMKHSTQKKKK